MRRHRFCILTILTILTSGVILGQTPRPEIQSGFVAQGIRKPTKDDPLILGTNIVSVPISVIDREGRFASQLDKANFEVYDEGIRQKIELFAQEDAPLAIGIVYDLNGSMQSQRSRAMTTLGKFLESINKEDEFFTIGISTKPALLNDFTNDPKSIAGKVAFTETRGRTAEIKTDFAMIQSTISFPFFRDHVGDDCSRLMNDFPFPIFPFWSAISTSLESGVWIPCIKL